MYTIQHNHDKKEAQNFAACVSKRYILKAKIVLIEIWLFQNVVSEPNIFKWYESIIKYKLVSRD